MSSQTRDVPIVRVHAGETSVADDPIAIEEPLEIRVGDRPVSVTMRTPGDDFELAAGFLFTEGILRRREEIETMRHWGSPNVVRVAIADGVKLDLQRLQRNFYSGSSCGICGKASIDALRVHAEPLADGLRIDAAIVAQLPDLLRAQQKAFDATGAIHATGAFARDGSLVRVREDVGRHNATDKVVGSLFLEGAAADVLVVSGRTSFEIVQKAIVARIPILAAVGAPSSLAVELAQELNLTLLGFVRDGRFNIYSGRERIA